MGICGKCKLEKHRECEKTYPVKIGKKSALGAKTREATCDCVICRGTASKPTPAEIARNRQRESKEAVSAPSPARPMRLWPERGYTPDPCPTCGDPSHWDVRGGSWQPDGDNPRFVTLTDMGDHHKYCLGCARCQEHLARIELPSVAGVA